MNEKCWEFLDKNKGIMGTVCDRLFKSGDQFRKLLIDKDKDMMPFLVRVSRTLAQRYSRDADGMLVLGVALGFMFFWQQEQPQPVQSETPA